MLCPENSCQIIDALLLGAGHAIALPGIRCMPADPAMPGLSGTADLGGDRLNGCPLGGVGAAAFIHQAYGTLTNYRGELY